MKPCNLNVLVLENSLLIKIVKLIRAFEFNYLVKTMTGSKMTHSMEDFDVVQNINRDIGKC
jgi:hypothetical protein